MNKTMARREFLSRIILTGGAASLSSTLLSCNQITLPKTRGLLNLEPDLKNICDLPKGFTYTVISREGELMTDGHKVPGFHDGMGCFAGPDGHIVLVRNHETPFTDKDAIDSPTPQYAYDPKASGGTTTIWLDDQLKVIKHHLSLTGTIRNCGGGSTPWGTWISSEEAGYNGWFMGKRHGYNFEVNPLNSLQLTQPLKAMGRFNHEAVAVDATSGIAYQTEDNGAGCFYRFIPNVPEKFENGGKLQALKVRDKTISHTTNTPLSPNKPYACEWVDIDEPDPKDNTVSSQAIAKGAAIFVRGEGIAIHDDGIYFSCTDGGKAGIGQFFKYVPNQNGTTGTIELVYEVTKDSIMQNPDNITLNTWGDLIICEDSGRDEQYLIGLTPHGTAYYIASNYRSEWAGACFSPDGKILFANIQYGPGMTIAITGPWENLRV